MAARIALFAAIALALAACGQKDTAKAPAAGDTAAPASATAQASGPVAMPTRKPGLWLQTVSMGDFKQSTRLCLDAATDKSMSLWGAQATQEMCSQTQMSRGLDGSISFSSTCDMGSGGKSTSKGVVKGDFNSKYTVEADTTTEGASAPQMNGSRKMTLEAAWQGPCPADFKPGDMELPGGMKMNVAELSKMSGGAQ